MAGKFVRRIFWSLLAVVAAILLFMGVVLYQVVYPDPTAEGVQPMHYLLEAEDVSWLSDDGQPVAGWWFGGKGKTPAVLLSPGYGMSRSDALSLAATLSGGGFSVLLYEQRGCGPAPSGPSTFGLREADDLLLALDYLVGRPEVDPERIGVWGVDVGAWAALKGAEWSSRIRAVAADSPYMSIPDFMALKASLLLGLGNDLLREAFRRGSQAYLWIQGGGGETTLSGEELGDRPILLIEGENGGEAGDLNRELFEQLAGSKEVLRLPSARVRNMNTEAFKQYDQEVLQFFVRVLGAAS